MTIQNMCEEKNVRVDAVWIPRNRNKRADKLSRLADRDDWHIRWKEFFHLDGKWGPHDCDRFAGHYNTKCKIFNSRCWCKGTSGIDAFCQTGTSAINWWVPLSPFGNLHVSGQRFGTEKDFVFFSSKIMKFYHLNLSYKVEARMESLAVPKAILSYT